MLTFGLLPFGVEVILVPLIVTAAVYDIRFRRIPNWLNIVGALTGLAMNSFLYQGWVGLRFSLIGLAVGLGAYSVLYSLRAMGAGDVKLMAAVGAMVGFQNWLGILLATAIIGGLTGLTLVVVRGRLTKTIRNMGFILSELRSGRRACLANEELDVRNPKSLGLPHGAVIAAGTIAFLGLSAHFSR